MIYVLILYFSMAGKGGEAVTTQEFESQETCLAAKDHLLTVMKRDRWVLTNWTIMECVKK
jgi:hypothetical protein